MKQALSLIYFLAMLYPSTVLGQWIENGTPVTVSGGLQGYPQMVDDGQGCAIISWQSCNLYSDIFAQRIDGNGYRLWGPDGISICNANNTQELPSMIKSSDNNIIVTWADKRNGVFDIYAQKIGCDGVPLWGLNGAPVCTLPGSQWSPLIVPDKNGGCIIFWIDQGTVSYHAQRLDKNGIALWTTGGVLIAAKPFIQCCFGAPDDSNGLIAVWQDNRNGSPQDLFCQRLDSLGNQCWDSNGISVCEQPDQQYIVSMVPDSTGGVIVSWGDWRYGQSDIYAQRINAQGVCMWATNGVRICDNSSVQYGDQLEMLNGQYCLSTWSEIRNASYSIIVQKIDLNGNNQWLPDGTVICVNNAHTADEKVSLCDGGYYIAWSDDRSGNYDVFVQRIRNDTLVRWDPTGKPICIKIGDQRYGKICTDGADGAYIAYQGGSDYIQRIDRWDGNWWGKNAPQIKSIADVPADQGGYVTVSWRRSVRDTLGDTIVQKYAVWRSPTGNINDPTTYNWSWLADVPVSRDSSYSIIASTQQDSIGPAHDSINYHYFKIMVHTIDSAITWCSLYDSGYSVDNILPDSVKNLTGMNLGGGLVQITWGSNIEADLKGYRIYKATDTLFVPHDTLRIAAISDTIFVDSSYTPGQHYKIAAVDIHNNTSVPVLLRLISGVTGDPGQTLKHCFSIGHVKPNPSNGTISLQYQLEKPGEIVVRIYNIAGQLVWAKPTIKGQDLFGTISCDIRQCSNGVYYLKLEAGTKTVLRKFIIIK